MATVGRVVKHPEHLGDLRLLGERLCLNFANSVDPRHGDRPRDFLTDYPALVAWARHARVLPDADAARLAREARRRPADASAVFARASALREAMYRVFLAVASGHPPPAPDLDALNSAVADAMTHARLVATRHGYAWGWEDDPRALDRPLWPIVRSAADLLVSDQLDRVRECPGQGDCGWLFLDTSKNGSRRWCSMDGCGNRAKARRHHARHRAAGSAVNDAAG